VKPLGLGPLALAEQTARTKAPSRNTNEPEKDTTTEPTFTRNDSPAKPESSAAPGSSIKAELTNDAIRSVDAGVEGSKSTIEQWLGVYQGHDVTRYVMAGQPDRNYDDSKAKIRVERSNADTLSFVFVDSSNGQDLCSLHGEVAGNEAKLPAGQRCFIDPDENMNVSSRPGLAKRNGDKLTLDVIIDTTFELEDSQAEGRIEYEFEGTK
jgi:hypothetical protein